MMGAWKQWHHETKQVVVVVVEEEEKLKRSSLFRFVPFPTKLSLLWAPSLWLWDKQSVTAIYPYDKRSVRAMNAIALFWMDWLHTHNLQQWYCTY